jgi:hypothetical protein
VAVILVTWEAEIQRIVVLIQPKEKFADPISTNDSVSVIPAMVRGVK